MRIPFEMSKEEADEQFDDLFTPDFFRRQVEETQFKDEDDGAQARTSRESHADYVADKFGGVDK